MSVVTLCSGGLDSALMATIFVERKVRQWPLFINYGQLSARKELESCRAVCNKLQLPPPTVIDAGGYGATIQSGLTSTSCDVFLDAFTPGRNLLFLTLAASYGFKNGVRAVAIGLLREDLCLFPDQTDGFISAASAALSAAMGAEIQVLMPLRMFSKSDVVAAAAKYGVTGTYSCHRGTDVPCGICVSCREYITD
jgi:7-cyano-7-deazaguanine synthase